MKGKKRLLAEVCYRSGLLSLIRLLPARPQLLVLNYHRVGVPEATLFDSGVFSCTAADFEKQMSWLARTWRVLKLNEVLDLAANSFKNITEPCVLLTFDDGYRDNYELAFPVLRRHGLSAVFFIPTLNLTSPTLMWWDQIAYITKHCQKTRLALRYPHCLEVDCTDKTVAIKTLLDLYKRNKNIESHRLVEELQAAAEVDADWKQLTDNLYMKATELREMVNTNMFVGSHTHSHEILSHLNRVQQLEELQQSRDILTREVGTDVSAISYPVGARDAFTSETKQLARETGYQLGFSFYGGHNSPGGTDAFDVHRIGIEHQSVTARYKAQLLCPIHVGWSI